jgi:hypothetical protein
MSNVKSCEIHDRRKLEGFHRCLSIWSHTAPKRRTKVNFDGKGNFCKVKRIYSFYINFQNLSDEP